MPASASVADRFSASGAINAILTEVVATLGQQEEHRFAKSGFLAGTRPVSVGELAAEDQIIAYFRDLADKCRISFRFISTIHDVVRDIVRGELWGTVVIRGLSGFDIYRRPGDRLTTPQAVMVAVFSGPQPVLADCLAAGVVNLFTGEILVAGHDVETVSQRAHSPIAEPVEPAGSPIAYCEASGRARTQLIARFRSRGFVVIGNVLSPGIRYLYLAAGRAGIVSGWVRRGQSIDAIIGLSLVRLSGGTVVDHTGVDLGLRPIDSITAGAGFVCAGTAELVKTFLG